MIHAPCKDCPDRRVGCHNPEVCPRWADFQEAQERRPAGNVELRDYIFRSIRRYQKEKQRHERT